jgi:hypothetical protein
MDAVFAATVGGLQGAAEALTAMSTPRIGLITGFYVPGSDPPAAETDGPAGAALLAASFVQNGLICRLASDTICQSACRCALDAAGAPDVPIDAVASDGDLDAVIDGWRRHSIDWVIAIERCGPATDDVPRNMRGIDVSQFTARLDRLFSAGPWRTIAIGDGGNEIGMGSVPRSLIAQHVPLGEKIGCVVPADFLVTAGVSHWVAYALLAALAWLRRDWSDVILKIMDPDIDRSIVEAMVRDGPAVDGVTLARAATIDGLDMAIHRAMLASIIALVRSG